MVGQSSIQKKGCTALARTKKPAAHQQEGRAKKAPRPIYQRQFKGTVIKKAKAMAL